MDNNSTFLLPGQSSTVAPEVDTLFYFIFYTALILFVLVVGGMIYFGIKYRQKSDVTPLTSGVDNNHILELVWTIIPTILVIIVFFWGFKTYMRMSIAPKDAIEIKVSARKWFWTFDYPQGMNTMHKLTVPVGEPVKLIMSSQDVIHSFFVPNFRIKMDVLPNRYTMTWFEAEEIGEYDLYCAQYCGKGHSEMVGKIEVLSKEDYENWLAATPTFDYNLPLEEIGAELYRSKACITCHALDGSKIVGPPLSGIFGKNVTHSDGTTAIVDENYIRKSLLDPKADLVAGFSPVMPTFQGILKDREIDALVAYIKSLTD